MSLKIYNKTGKAYGKGAGKYLPLNIYSGNKKITGYHSESKTGEIATWINTYNDKLRGILYGKSIQKADYVVNDGLSEQRAVVGKNLVGYNNSLPYTANGVTISRNADGSFSIVGTSTGYPYKSIWTIPAGTLSGTYTVNFIRLKGTNAAGRIYDRVSNTNITYINASPVQINIAAGHNDLQVEITCEPSKVYDEIINIQLEKGSTATAYEPYVRPSQNPGINMFVLPNGVADTYDSGTKTYTQKVKEYTLKASDILLVTAYTKLDYVAIAKPTDSIFYNNASTYVGASLVLNYPNASASSADDVNNIGKSFHNTHVTYIYLGIPKGTYANSAAAQAVFAGTKIKYQLATPITSVLPSPTFPLEIINNISAGTYKITMPDGIYEVALAEPLRGIGANLDKIVVDRVSKKAWRNNIVGSKVLNGTETYADAGSYFTLAFANINPRPASLSPVLCTHFPFEKDFAKIGIWAGSVAIAINKAVQPAFNDVTTLKSWLTLNPVTLLYNLEVPTRTMLTLTKVASSTAPELPASAYSTAVSPDYPQPIYDAGGNMVSKRLQMLTNGNFVNGTAGWSVGRATKAFSDGKCKITGDGTASTAMLYQVKSIASGKKFYIRASVFNETTQATGIATYTGGGSLQIKSNPPVNTWNICSGIVTTVAAINEIYLYIQYANGATATNAVSYIDDVMAIDLTEAGWESKTLAELDAISWQDVGSSTFAVPTNRGIQVASTATDYTYIDGSGNKWIADTLEYVGNGIWNKVQRVGYKVFDGTEIWSKYTSNTTQNVYYMTITDSILGYQTSICSHFINVNSSYGATTGIFGYYSDHATVNRKYFNLGANYLTVEEWKAYLGAQNAAGAPVTVEYILASPITSQVNLGDLKTYPWGTTLTQNGYNVATPFNLSVLIMD